MTSGLPGAPAIDYTSRDYLSIRDDLLALKQTLMPEWTSESPNDFGVVLLELWAYIADQMHYYADRVANEAYIDTATQRANVIRLARMLGYTPANAIAASATLTFTNSTASALTVPALTQIATATNNVSDTPVTFETDVALTVPANSTATVLAHQGETITAENFGTSDGSQAQTYALFNTGVIQGSVTVTVAGTTWTYVPRLVTSGPYDTVYSLLTDENGVTYVQFGDGANGQIPTNGAALLATYRIGGGTVGNVAAGTLTNIITNVPAGITVTNQASATGGSDIETTQSIRSNAVKSLTTLQRAVTLNDYANLAVTVPGCGKASAMSMTYNSVMVHVAPQGGQGYDGTNGITGNATMTLMNLMGAVGQYLDTVKPATTTVTVMGPVYVPINITVTLNLTGQTSASLAANQGIAALTDLLAFDSVIFGDQITPNDVYLALSGINGVIYSSISLLSRSATGMDVVTMAMNEIPVIGTITVNTSGGTT